MTPRSCDSRLWAAALACSCWLLLLTSGAAAQTPSAPASPTICQVASPDCFAGCPAHEKHTRSGACVPEQPPPMLDPAAGVLEALPTRGPVRAEPAASTPTDPPPSAGDASPAPTASCCLIDLSIAATGLKNLGERAEIFNLHYDVYVNGRLLGSTPYADALPAGDYVAQLRAPHGALFGAPVKLRPGAPVQLRARVELMLTAAEKVTRDVWRKRRIALHEAVLRNAAEREHAAWSAATADARATRASHTTWGIVSGIASTAIIAVAAGSWVAANAANDDVHSFAAEWRLATDAGQRERLATNASDAESRRSTFQALGFISLGLGTLGIATAIALLATRPDIAPEPGAPRATGDSPAVATRWSDLGLRLQF